MPTAIPLQPLSFVVFRTPLLPFSHCLGLTPEILRQLYQQPVLQEAIFLASPHLHEQLLKWLSGELAGQPAQKIQTTLAKYLLRMCYRSTPFGLFAGITKAGLGEKTCLQLQPLPAYRRSTRLDMDYLCALAWQVGRQEEVKKNLIYIPNSTLYRIGDQYRYVEVRVQEQRRTHHLVNVQATPYLDEVLARARDGAIPEALAALLVDEETCVAEADAFIDALIESQLLVSTLQPSVTGGAFASLLLRTLSAAGENQTVPNALAETTGLLSHLDETAPGWGISSYAAAAARLEGLGVPFQPGQLFQVDLCKPAREATLGSSVVEEVQKAVQLLAGLPLYREPENLLRFKEAFMERYESEAVPLLQVLDSEAGLGYPLHGQTPADRARLIEGIEVGAALPEPESHPLTPWQQFLLDRYAQALQTGSQEILLEDQAVAPFLQANLLPLPASLHTMGSVFAPSAQAVDEGDFRVHVWGTAGPSAATLLGRFCHLDGSLTEAVREALREEERSFPEAVFAEIVHLNQGRIGNIVQRPVLRPYEIPILVQPSVDEAHTIRLEDLLVAVRYGRVVLWSKKLGKEVVPRLSSAHDYSLDALPVYHFLCDLQFQDVQANPAWNWGILRKAAFLPRVRYSKVILARASWRLEPLETKTLKTLQGEQLLSHVGSLRERKRLPRWVVAAEGDNQLPLDLENLLCLQVLQSLLKGDEPLLLEECLAASDGCWVEGSEGRFTHEFILPLRSLSKAPVPTQVDSEAPALLRRLHPGSEWLYAKLYCGVKTADKLLTAVLAPLTERLLAEGTIDKWFFIRYDDPHSHLRVRFYSQGNFQTRVLEALHQELAPFFAANLVWKFQTDTYVRELERYGGENIVDSESLFFHDSVAVVRLLPLLAGDAGDEVRWRLALRGIDGLLNDFGLDLPAKRTLLFGLQAHFKGEFGANTAKGKKSLGDKLRKERSALATALQASYAPDHPLAVAFDVLAQRSEDWREVVQSIKAKTLSVPPESLLGSYVHMFCNRIFRSRQRLQEMVAYDFLYHHYQAMAARSSDPRNIEKALDTQNIV